jgi:hypothetical protein
VRAIYLESDLIRNGGLVVGRPLGPAFGGYARARLQMRCPRPFRFAPQSSSASRFTAGAAGFLTLSQCADRPGRYGEPRRFDTMPSQPSAQACWKMAAPSPLKCLLKAMPSPAAHC